MDDRKIHATEALLKRSGLTDFQKSVLMAVAGIPRGKVMTYRQVAELVGEPKSYRAVGTALRKNPFPIRIPCHRVIRSDGKLGNYSSGGTRMKRKLLLSEGAMAKMA